MGSFALALLDCRRDRLERNRPLTADRGLQHRVPPLEARFEILAIGHALRGPQLERLAIIEQAAAQVSLSLAGNVFPSVLVVHPLLDDGGLAFEHTSRNRPPT